jgi:hypothetical protein
MKHKIFLFAIVSLLLFSLCRCANDASYNEEGTLNNTSGACFPETVDKYVYPITPGMKEWQTAGDMEAVFKLIQLPDSVLSSISTLGLIDALVQAPLFSGFYLLSSSSVATDTWHRHYERFNSATELFGRDDAGKVLIKYYQAISFDCIESSADDENFRPLDVYERIFGLEFLFTKQEILNKIGHQDKQTLVEALLSKYEQKPDRWMVIIPMAYIMLDDNYPPIVKYHQNNTELYNQLIANGFTTEQSGLILSFANSFIGSPAKSGV